MENEKNQPTAEQIEQWKKEHGGMICVTAEDKDYYLRKPNRPEYKRFLDTVQRSVSDASLTLVSSCLMHPDQQSLRTDCIAQPSLHMALVGELQDQFGGNLTATSKKL